MSDRLREVVRDAVVLALGVVLVVSTIWLPVDSDAGVSGAILILGMLSAGTALWALSSASRASHWSHIVFGLMLAVSPLVLAFPAGLLVADMFAIVGGLLIAAMGVLGVADGRRGVSALSTSAPSFSSASGSGAPSSLRVRATR